MPFVVLSTASWCLSDDEDPIQGWHTPRVDGLESCMLAPWSILMRSSDFCIGSLESYSPCLWWNPVHLSVMVTPRYLADVTAASNCPRMVYSVTMGFRLLVTVRTVHFAGWNCMHQSSPHCASLITGSGSLFNVWMYPPNVNLVSDYRIRESGYCLNVSFIIPIYNISFRQS